MSEKKKKISADELETLVRHMDEEEFKRFQQKTGAHLHRLPPDADTMARVWGYRCKACDKIGLIFLGDKWFVEINGVKQVQDQPPCSGISIEDFHWVQDGQDGDGNVLSPGHPVRDNSRFQRSKPRCQYCAQELAFTAGGWLRPDRLMELRVWKEVKRRQASAQRDVSYQRDLGYIQAEGPRKARMGKG